jgi:RND family efflux transporter MFP subunit
MSKKIMAGLMALFLTAGAAGFGIMRIINKNRAANLANQYETVVLEREDLSDTVDTTGTLAFSQNGELYAAYNATVLQINRKVGDRVKKGELLMVLDSSTLKASWMEAQNTYQKALFNFKLAEKTLAREKILYKAQAITIDTLETAQNNVDTYRADVELARFNLEKLKVNADGYSYLSPDHTKLWIKAPFDGVIAWIDVKTGETVKVASSTSSDSTLLLTMAADNSVIVSTDVDESEIDKVKPGQKAVVTLNDQAETKLEGTVITVSKIGETDNDVVVFTVEIKVALPPVKVNSGMTADVTIMVTSRENRLTIPAKAVVDRRGRKMVRVAQGTEVTYIPVTLGEQVDTKIEVLTGLKEGDQILVVKTTFSGSSGNKGNNSNNRGRQRGGGMGDPPPMM